MCIYKLFFIFCVISHIIIYYVVNHKNRSAAHTRIRPIPFAPSLGQGIGIWVGKKRLQPEWFTSLRLLGRVRQYGAPLGRDVLRPTAIGGRAITIAGVKTT